MKIDSGTAGTNIIAACAPCIKKALARPENAGKFQLEVPRWMKAECDVCHKITAVANVKSYGYPIFNVKER